MCFNRLENNENGCKVKFRIKWDGLITVLTVTCSIRDKGAGYFDWPRYTLKYV